MCAPKTYLLIRMQISAALYSGRVGFFGGRKSNRGFAWRQRTKPFFIVWTENGIVLSCPGQDPPTC